jgi:hypothetical protein
VPRQEATLPQIMDTSLADEPPVASGASATSLAAPAASGAGFDWGFLG